MFIPLNVWNACELDRAWTCCGWLCPPSVEPTSGVTQQCQGGPWIGTFINRMYKNVKERERENPCFWFKLTFSFKYSFLLFIIGARNKYFMKDINHMKSYFIKINLFMYTWWTIMKKKTPHKSNFILMSSLKNLKYLNAWFWLSIGQFSSFFLCKCSSCY